MIAGSTRWSPTRSIAQPRRRRSRSSAASAGCATSSRPTTGTGTCSGSSATSCARPGGGPCVRDRKTGFCLGDRYAVTDRALPARAPAPALHVALRARRAGPARHHRRHLRRLRRRLRGQPRRPVPAADRAARRTLRARAPRQRRPPAARVRYDNNAASLLLRPALEARRAADRGARQLPGQRPLRGASLSGDSSRPGLPRVPGNRRAARSVGGVAPSVS